MDEHKSILAQRAEYDKTRKDKYKSDSKVRLLKILKKKIETTMIGSLSSIENHFGFLWNANGSGEMTPEQQTLYDTYQKIRSEILDKGNTQARNIEAELNQYDVEWLRYQMTIPVKPLQRDKD